MKPPWTVDWEDAALDELALIWLNSADPQAVTDAQDRIDILLSHQPLDHGAEVSEGLRRLTVPPLYVLYSVDEEQKTVEISAVREST